MSNTAFPTAGLAQLITHSASKQSSYTIQLLVPQDRQDDAYRAYAYFRWVDDLLDGDELNAHERNTFLDTQKSLLDCCLNGKPPRDLCSEEWLLVALTQGSLRGDPGLTTYLTDMMAVMEFDARRRYKRINQRELEWYSRRLATAVTEAVYTFIGASCNAPHTYQRYAAADAAHITHMLRDLHDDLDAGYINIPEEIMPGQTIRREELGSSKFRSWVNQRVDLARSYFREGAAYLTEIQNPRCRVAGAWYSARFTGVLDAIEKEDYILRKDYNDCLGTQAVLRMTIEGLRALLGKTPTPQISIDQPAYMPTWNRELRNDQPILNVDDGRWER
jgi:phytoene/squalene synthetase